MSIARLSTATLAGVAVAALIAFAPPASVAAERTVKIAGWGAKSGPLRSFGVNSEAVLTAAVQSINDAGGVKLGDGTMAMMEFDYHDSACNADQAISVARKVESQSEALVGIGPTCSGAAGGHVRHLPEDGGRRLGYRPPVPHPHRHRDSPRPRQEVPVDLSQCAERDHHVRRAVQVAARTVPGRDDDLRGNGDRSGPLPADLRDRHRPHGPRSTASSGSEGASKGLPARSGRASRTCWRYPSRPTG